MKDILSIERVVGFVLRKLLYQILDEIDLQKVIFFNKINKNVIKDKNQKETFIEDIDLLG